jgi:hypothetical protein
LLYRSYLGLRIDASEGEGLEGHLCTVPARLGGEPLDGSVIDFRPRAVVSLGVIRLQYTRNPLF